MINPITAIRRIEFELDFDGKAQDFLSDETLNPSLHVVHSVAVVWTAQFSIAVTQDAPLFTSIFPEPQTVQTVAEVCAVQSGMAVTQDAPPVTGALPEMQVVQRPAVE